jgi:hypothetical protein
MALKLNKFDIGAEVISILTRGMYPDPMDTLREYIQNAVDAKAENVHLKIRQNSVTVDDDGTGMDYQTLRNAIRVGVSDKNPKTNVGFMGIGIYSSFHLCDKLIIYSSDYKKLPCKLEMNFRGMRDLLSEQKELRFENQISSNKLTDLQTLLEKYIFLTEEGELKPSDFPSQGTRVELIGLEPVFYSLLSEFDDSTNSFNVSNYLRDVVPLHFDKENFEWGELIEKRITEICQQHDAKFELLNIKLQVNNAIEHLYRPYKNSDFKNNEPQEPLFQQLKKDNIFLGVAWGCLNSTRDKVSNKELRGFLIKKQGFAIGKRENLAKYFRQSTHFDRYIGEVVLVHPEILPNSSRSDLEYSNLRTIFYEKLAEVADKYNQHSREFQEYSKGDELIDEFAAKLKEINTKFNPFEEDTEKLVKIIVKLKEIFDTIDRRIKRKSIRESRRQDAESVRTTAKQLERNTQNRLNELVKKRRRKSTKSESKKSQVDIAKDLSAIDTKPVETKNYENLVELLEDLDFPLTEELKNILFLIDEKFIQAVADSRLKYYELLNELKDEITETVT